MSRFIPFSSLLVFLGIATGRIWAQGPPDVVWMRGGHATYVNALDYSRDGQFLVSGSGDTTIKLWRLSDQRLLRTFTGHRDYVLGVKLSPDGTLLASASSDKTVRI
jgi:WD40 repeat protein